MDPNNSPFNKPSDNFAFKNDEEKEELLDQIQSLRIRLMVRIGLILLGAIAICAIGLILYYLSFSASN